MHNSTLLQQMANVLTDAITIRILLPEYCSIFSAGIETRLEAPCLLVSGSDYKSVQSCEIKV